MHTDTRDIRPRGMLLVQETQLMLTNRATPLVVSQNCDHFQTCFKDGTFCHSIR